MTTKWDKATNSIGTVFPLYETLVKNRAFRKFASKNRITPGSFLGGTIPHPAVIVPGGGDGFTIQSLNELGSKIRVYLGVPEKGQKHNKTYKIFSNGWDHNVRKRGEQELAADAAAASSNSTSNNRHDENVGAGFAAAAAAGAGGGGDGSAHNGIRMRDPNQDRRRSTQGGGTQQPAAGGSRKSNHQGVRSTDGGGNNLQLAASGRRPPRTPSRGKHRSNKTAPAPSQQHQHQHEHQLVPYQQTNGQNSQVPPSAGKSQTRKRGAGGAGALTIDTSESMVSTAGAQTPTRSGGEGGQSERPATPSETRARMFMAHVEQDERESSAQEHVAKAQLLGRVADMLGPNDDPEVRAQVALGSLEFALAGSGGRGGSQQLQQQQQLSDGSDDWHGNTDQDSYEEHSKGSEDEEFDMERQEYDAEEDDEGSFDDDVGEEDGVGEDGFEGFVEEDEAEEDGFEDADEDGDYVDDGYEDVGDDDDVTAGIGQGVADMGLEDREEGAQSQDVNQLIQELESRSPQRRAVAVQSLCQLFRHSNDDVRLDAAMTLSYVDVPSFRDLLLEAGAMDALCCRIEMLLPRTKAELQRVCGMLIQATDTLSLLCACPDFEKVKSSLVVLSQLLAHGGDDGWAVDIITLQNVCVSLSHLTSKSDKQTRAVIDALPPRAFTRLLQLLREFMSPDLQFKALNVVRNIAAAPSDDPHKDIVQDDVVFNIRQLVSSPDKEMRELALVALGKVASINPTAIVGGGCVPLLKKWLSSNAPICSRVGAAWVLVNAIVASVNTVGASVDPTGARKQLSVLAGCTGSLLDLFVNVDNNEVTVFALRSLETALEIGDDETKACIIKEAAKIRELQELISARTAENVESDRDAKEILDKCAKILVKYSEGAPRVAKPVAEPSPFVSMDGNEPNGNNEPDVWNEPEAEGLYDEIIRELTYLNLKAICKTGDGGLGLGAVGKTEELREKIRHFLEDNPAFDLIALMDRLGIANPLV